jgi:FkbM family methyltransferase
MKKLIHAALARMGYRLMRIDSLTRMEKQMGMSCERFPNFLRVLQRAKFQPAHIVDVGANLGYWTRQALNYFPAARYTLVEPQAELKQGVADLIAAGRQIEWIQAGVSDKPGRASFTIADQAHSSSFSFSAEQARQHGWRQVEMEVITLDGLTDRIGAIPQMVKIDAEGYDLRVLAGAGKLLGVTDIFFVEAAVGCRTLENNLARVISRMHEAGYRAVELTDLNQSPKHDVLWLVELAFLREGSPLFDFADSY